MNSFGKTSRLYVKTALNSVKETYIADSFFTSPFKIMKPFKKDDGGLTVYIQTASAGLMEGDEQEQYFNVGEGSSLELLSLSFEKIFKAENRGFASRKVNANVSRNAELIYTPLPCMPFSGSAFKSSISIDLEDASSRLIFSDCICSGRKAHGEMFDYRYYRNLLQVKCAGHLVYSDNTFFEGSDSLLYPEKKALMQSIHMYGNYSHLGTLLAFGYSLDKEKLCQSLGIEEKLLYAEGYETDCQKPLASFTKTSGGGTSIKVLAQSAEEIQDIFSAVKKSISL